MIARKSQRMLEPKGTWQCLILSLPIGVLCFSFPRRQTREQQRERQGAADNGGGLRMLTVF